MHHQHCAGSVLAPCFARPCPVFHSLVHHISRLLHDLEVVKAARRFRNRLGRPVRASRAQRLGASLPRTTAVARIVVGACEPVGVAPVVGVGFPFLLHGREQFVGGVPLDPPRRHAGQVVDVEFEAFVVDPPREVLMLQPCAEGRVDDPGSHDRENEDADPETDRRDLTGPDQFQAGGAEQNEVEPSATTMNAMGTRTLSEPVLTGRGGDRFRRSDPVAYRSPAHRAARRERRRNGRSSRAEW